MCKQLHNPLTETLCLHALFFISLLNKLTTWQDIQDTLYFLPNLLFLLSLPTQMHPSSTWPHMLCLPAFKKILFKLINVKFPIISHLLKNKPLFVNYIACLFSIVLHIPTINLSNASKNSLAFK